MESRQAIRKKQREHPNLLRVMPPALVEFCGWFYEATGTLVPVASPDEVAMYFHAFFELKVPFKMFDARVLTSILGQLNIEMYPRLHEETTLWGAWAPTKSGIYIRIDATQSEVPQVKTFLHELYEMLCEIAYKQVLSCRCLSTPERERNAKMFAAYVKMPRDEFYTATYKYGFDIDKLRDEFKDTFQGVARQIRDVVAWDFPYYVVRFRIEQEPEDACPKLLDVASDTGGFCAQILDVVNSNRIATQAPYWRGKRIPLHNIPTRREWRVMPAEVLQAIQERQLVYLPSISATSNGKHFIRDLFGEYDMSLLVKPPRVKDGTVGTIIGFHPSKEHNFLPQLESPALIRNTRLMWMFSDAFYQRPLVGRRVEKNVLSQWDDESGMRIYEMTQDPYSWDRFKPFNIPRGDEQKMHYWAHEI